VLLNLLGGHLDGNPRVGPRGELGEHLLAYPPHHAAGEPGAQRIEVPDTADLGPPVYRRRVPWHQAPFRLQREVIHPLDDRRQILDPVLHWRPGQHQAVRRIELLHRQRGLGRPVLHPLGLVEHDDVGVPVPDDVEVAEELLVVGQEESPAAGLECRAALAGIAVDHGGGGIGEELPLTKPLRLEGGGNDEQPAIDAPRVPQGVAGSDRLRGLPEAHVVGEEEPPLREEPLDGLPLIGVEPLLESPERTPEAAQVPGALDRARDPSAVLLEQSVERGLAAPTPERDEQFLHQL